MKVHVVRRLGRKEFDIVEIDLDDVLFTYVEGSVIKYQTKTEVFSQISTLEEQERLFSTMGFAKLERGYLVHMEKVEWFDEDTYQVFFERHPSKALPSAPVARAHRKDIPEGKVVKPAPHSVAKGLYYPTGR